MISLPILIVWGIACPLLALGAIYYGKSHPENQKIKEYFIILYQGLKPETIYWEFVNTIRKMVLLVSLLFDRTVTIYISILVLMLTARLQIYLKPYKDPENFKVEFLAIMAGVVTIMGALIYLQNDQHTILNVYVFLAIVGVNIKFIIEWLFLVILIYETKNPLMEYVRLLIISSSPNF